MKNFFRSTLVALGAGLSTSVSNGQVFVADSFSSGTDEVSIQGRLPEGSLSGSNWNTPAFFTNAGANVATTESWTGNPARSAEGTGSSVALVSIASSGASSNQSP